MAVDDQRTAVGFSVTLSGQLIAASMALLAVEGAYVLYAMGSRTPRGGFVVVALLAAMAILASIFTAGKGITKARNAGFDGNWSLAEGRRQFNLQGKLLLLALALLAVTFLLIGPVRESSVETRVNDLTGQVAALREEVAQLRAMKSENSSRVAPPSVSVQPKKAQRKARKNRKRHR